MKKFLRITKTVLLSILFVVCVSLLFVTLHNKFGREYNTNKMDQYTPEEVYQGIKDSFDETVVPAMSESLEILEEGLEDPQKVIDEFTEN